MHPTLFRTPGVRAFAEAVDQERQAQLAKWGEQHHPDGTADGPVLLGRSYAVWAQLLRARCQAAADAGEVTWALILLEEVFEALAEDDPAKLRAELVQAGAVIAAWVTDLDTRPAAVPCTCTLAQLCPAHATGDAL